MGTTNLINAQTIAVTTGAINIIQDEGFVTFMQEGLTGSENVVLQQRVNGTWIPIVESGTAIVLDVNNTNQSCKGPAVIRLVKGTTAATSVDMISRNPSA